MYGVWECMGCGNLWGVEVSGCFVGVYGCVGVYGVWECTLIFKRALQPFNIKGPLKKIPRWKKEGKADLYLILENHLQLEYFFASLSSLGDD